MRFGSFIQAWSTHSGRGRVIAWGDSTIFSNFCLYQPGKAQVLLNLVEWLNHRGGTGVWWLWTMLGLAAMGNGLWLVRDDGSRAPCTHGRLVLVAAAACGWTVGSAATAALLAREMPLPVAEADRRLPCVVIDRTTSQAPLAKGPTTTTAADAGSGCWSKSIPRLGYTTVRAEGDGVFQGDAVVMICPSRPATEAFRKRLVEYVDGGGRLLVIDAGLNDVPSTSNQILRPFGLSFDYAASWQGELVLVEPWPRNKVDFAWEVLPGGQRVATLNGERAVCAIVPFGKGQVMVVSFGNMFNDKNLGNDSVAQPRSRGTGALRRVLCAHATAGEGRTDCHARRKHEDDWAQDLRSAQSARPPRHGPAAARWNVNAARCHADRAVRSGWHASCRGAPGENMPMPATPA